MIRIWGDGVFPSVALDRGFGWLAVREGDPRRAGALVVLTFTGTDLPGASELRRWPLPAGSPAFPQLYALDAEVWLAYHDGALQVLRNLTRNTSRTFSGLSNPVAFGNGSFAYCEPARPYRVIQINLRSDEITSPRQGAPTGLSRITDDGIVVTVDEARATAGRFTSNPRTAGPVTVYEFDNATVVGCGWTVLGQTGLLWPGLFAFTPSVAVDGARIAITTAGSGSVRLFCGSLAELVVMSQPPVVVPPQPGPPVLVPVPPHPIPPGPVGASMQLPAAVQSIVNALYARNVRLSEGTDDERRALTKQIVEQVVFAFPGQGWGWKSADPNRPPSKDAIAKQEGGRLIGWDLFNGATRKPNERPESMDLDGQNFIPVAGVDHLGGVPIPPPQPDTPTQQPPSVDLQNALSRIAALERDIVGLKNYVTDLEHQLRATEHPSYNAMMAMIALANTAYQGAKRKQGPLPPTTTAHLTYGFLLEGRTTTDIVDEARQRGAA